MDYFEKDLEIPFLKVLSEHRSGLPMSKIKEILLSRLNPTGSCAKPSPTRRPEIKLHQRIGNFTLRRQRRIFIKGYVTYDKPSGIYKITDAGVALLSENEDAYNSLISQGFSKAQRKREIDRDFKELIIEEGTQTEVSKKHRKRSKLLRDLKIKELKQQGKLECCACGFDFEKKYDGIGADFILIHHTKPIHTFDIEGNKEEVEEALKKVVPVCPNCHSMIHRNRDEMLSIAELKGIIRKQAESN